MSLELAYLAGAMDADGYFTIYRENKRGSRTYSEACGLQQTSPVVPEKLKRLFGGSVRLCKSRAKRWKPMYSWAASNRIAFDAVTALLPFLQIKTGQAKLIIALRKSKSLPTKRRRSVKVGGRFSYNTPEILLHREDLCASIRVLNSTGVEE